MKTNPIYSSFFEISGTGATKYDKKNINKNFIDSFSRRLNDKIEPTDPAIGLCIEYINIILKNIEDSVTKLQTNPAIYVTSFNIKYFYDITKKLVKLLKEVSIIIASTEYADIQADIRYLNSNSQLKTRTPLGICSGIQSDVLVLYFKNSNYKNIINQINENTFFDYDNFIIQFDKDFTIEYHKYWEKNKNSAV
jgi:hypothetical protein